MSTGQDDLEVWKRQRTQQLAFELADSGQYENFADIAYALQFERGLATAQALIENPEMRRLLNVHCANAREALLNVKAPAPEKLQAQSQPVLEAPELPTLEIMAAQGAPSFLRRAAFMLGRSARAVEPVNAGDFNSAAP
ncbi:hypothetical protein [Caballeronia sp. LZ001]|uniref:hypothetical protein n=1 Tax=Caballeronia sp. LZ001 TaxID=3038553 RepID=UPI00285EA5F0|nr:hypothetical protein [Caballeronia sp. LZ001]MDR5799626.1 hypothetical protein [Caballeronia sp. LZ001]